MMNKLLISLFLSSVITLGGCGLTKENYYVKPVSYTHLTLPTNSLV